MIDLALLQLLEPPLPPELPQLAVERVWLSSAAEQAKRSADRLVRDCEERIAGWKRKISDLKTAIASQAPAQMLSEGERAQFDHLIAEFEAYAETRAEQASRLEKRSRRDVKKQFKIDPSLASVTRTFSGRLLELDREVIEEILDYALFLRAFRSERISESRGGRTFADAGDLGRYLAAELA